MPPDNPQDRETWRAYVRAGGAPGSSGACPDAFTLAAYAEGRLAAAAAAAVEAHLAACRKCLDEAIELQALLTAGPMLPPPGLVARAKALVPAAAVEEHGQIARKRPARATPGWSITWRWAAAAVLAVAASVGGFGAGRTLAANRQATHDRLSAELASVLPSGGSDEDTLLSLLDEGGQP